MRSYIIPCLRNLKSQRQVLGLDAADFFLVLGIGLGLQSIYGNSFIIWLIVVVAGGIVRFIKRKTAPGAIWHFMTWFIRPKKYTAIEQTQGVPGKKG
jgi:hypothetical protein